MKRQLKEGFFTKDTRRVIDDDDDDDDGYDDHYRHHRSKVKKKKKRNNSLGERDLCLPPPGKTYLAIGQDLYSISEYLQEQHNASLHWYMSRMQHFQSPSEDNNNSDSTDDSSDDEEDDEKDVENDNDDDEIMPRSSNSPRLDDESTASFTAVTTTTPRSPEQYDYRPRMPVPKRDDIIPAAVMVYSDIQTLRGLSHPTDYGSGIEYADGALQLAPPRLPMGLQIGLWLDGAQGCHDIVSGKLDHRIDQLVYYMGSECSAEKIFLRIGYEFDNPDFLYATDPAAYQEAFKYIVQKCRKHKHCSRRVIFVWHSWAAGVPYNLTLDDFYPGNDYVDWMGVSVFQQFYPNAVGGTVQDLKDVLRFAAIHRKPTMIAESTPFGGIHHNSHIPKEGSNNIWEAWFEPTLYLIQEYDIAMWSYINCNWDIQPLWVGAGFGDTRLSIDDYVMDQWHDHVLASRLFVRATDYELCGNSRSDDDRYNRHDYQYISDERVKSDDDDYFAKFNNRHANSHHEVNKTTKPHWLWGERRGQSFDGFWRAVLPLVIMSSSLAVTYYMYLATRRRRYRRLDRTPRNRRVQFAALDEQEDDDDGSAALYGSICSSMDDVSSIDSNRWKRSSERTSVRRLGPNLVLVDTSQGSTTIA